MDQAREAPKAAGAAEGLRLRRGKAEAPVLAPHRHSGAKIQACGYQIPVVLVPRARPRSRGREAVRLLESRLFCLRLLRLFAAIPHSDLAPRARGPRASRQAPAVTLSLRPFRSPVSGLRSLPHPLTHSPIHLVTLSPCHLVTLSSSSAPAPALSSTVPPPSHSTAAIPRRTASPTRSVRCAAAGDA